MNSDRLAKSLDKRLYIFGAGGHALSVGNVAIAAGYRDIIFVSDDKKSSGLMGFSVKESQQVSGPGQIQSAAIAIGDNFKRFLILQSIIEQHKNCRFPILVHPSATISDFCKIGDGTVIMPNSVLGPNTKIGSFNIINTASNIDHETKTSDFVSIAPNATLGGGVIVGKYSAIGIGATISHTVKIGDNVIIGGASYVNRDVLPNSLAYGVPAKLVKSRSLGDPYL